jgi:hypothetical protein
MLLWSGLLETNEHNERNPSSVHVPCEGTNTETLSKKVERNDDIESLALMLVSIAAFERDRTRLHALMKNVNDPKSTRRINQQMSRKQTTNKRVVTHHGHDYRISCNHFYARWWSVRVTWSKRSDWLHQPQMPRESEDEERIEISCR